MGKNMSEAAAKVLIERFAAKQKGGDYPCPRCGRPVMASDPVRNALSRRATVYVCDECGMIEALEDMPGAFKLPLSAWSIAKESARWEVQLPKLQLRLVGRDSWSRPVSNCRRRDCFCDGCTEIGWKMDRCPATMFVWAKIPDSYHSSAEFVGDLLEKAGVLVTPGSAFGASGEGYVRIALVKDQEELRAAIERMEKSGIFRG